jgi:hypothetical protein
VPRAHGERRQGCSDMSRTRPSGSERVVEKHRSPLSCLHQAFLDILLATTTPTSCLKDQQPSAAILRPRAVSAAGLAEPPSLVEGQSPHPLSHTAGEKSTHVAQRASRAAAEITTHAAAGRCYETLSVCVGRPRRPPRLHRRSSG